MVGHNMGKDNELDSGKGLFSKAESAILRASDNLVVPPQVCNVKKVFGGEVVGFIPKDKSKEKDA
jgi:hypothetical protein